MSQTCKYEAPNKQPSKLYDDLYNLLGEDPARRVWGYTKTDEFKKFFGEWDTDPQNSSTATDSNGEPLVTDGYFVDTRSGEKLNVLSVSGTLTGLAEARIQALNKIRDKKKRYEKSGKTEAVEKISELENELADPGVLDKVALFRFIKYANGQVERAVTELDALLLASQDSTRTTDERRGDLRRLSKLIDYLESFTVLEQIAEPIRGQYYDQTTFGGSGKVDREFYKNWIESTLGAIKLAKQSYQTLAVPMVADFLYQHNQNKSLTKSQLESMLTTVHEDLSVAQRWADSLAESGDQVLALVDRAVSDVRNYVHQDAHTFRQKELLPILTELEDFQKSQGIQADDFEKFYNFMLDRDKDKKLTGKYRQPDDTAPEVYKKFFKFYNLEYSNSQKLIPAGYRHDMQLIPILKDATERAFNDVTGLKSAVNAAGKLIKQSVTRTGNDTDRVEKNFDENNEEFRFIPLHFTNFIGDKGVDPNDVSLNLASNLLRFRTMAMSHDRMAGIVTELEMTKDLVRDRKLHLKEGSKWVFNKNNNQPGVAVGENTNAYKKLDDYMTMHVYGEKQADEGVFNFFGVEVDKAKMYNNVAAWTAFSQLGLNVYSAINNTTVGNLMNFIETSGGQFYGRSDWTSSIAEYARSIPDLLKDYSQRSPTSKIGVVMEELDIFQEESPTGELLKEKGLLRRAGLHSVFFMQKAGEHATQSQLAISMFKSHRVVDGKIYGYTEWVTGNNRKFDKVSKAEFDKLPSVWSQLNAKDGMISSKLSKQELTRLAERIKGVYQRLHGNYAKRDTPSLNRWGMGRLVGLFRKFLKPAWNRRWAKDTFDGEWVGEGDERKFVPFDNFDQRLGANIGGNYTIAYNFLKSLASGYKQFNKMTLAEDWANLPEWKKQGIQRTATEAAAFASISLMVKALSSIEDEEDPSWLGAMGLYQMHRLKTELTAFVNPFTAMDLLRSPMASMSMIEKYGKVIAQLIPFYGWERFEAGENAGDLKLPVYAGKATPLYGQVRRIFAPKEELDWLTK